MVGYTKADIDNWAECAARSLACGGATAEDIVQIAYGYGLFTGGLGMHYGAERLGAAALPMSAGNTEKQIMLMQDFGVTVLCCTPSYALQIAEVAEQMVTKNCRSNAGFSALNPGRRPCGGTSKTFCR